MAVVINTFTDGVMLESKSLYLKTIWHKGYSARDSDEQSACRFACFYCRVRSTGIHG
jgi:hypothetical protein